ncbi:MAG TPA: cell division protein FtsZ [Flavobacteriales bacterium]|nr:cell division protein FtsZ [Flavobacteriales bacterium]
MIRFDLPKENSSIIKVIGVGGGGSNAVNHMYTLGIKGVDFLVCNTDKQALEKSPVPMKLQLGGTLTQGLGAGSVPEVGKNSAIESIDHIKSILAEHTKMVFITAGMGGGTGTGAAPVIAQAARDMDILTVGIVTIPFAFEGKRKRQQAEIGIEEMKKNVDCLLVIANDKLREIYGNLSISESFAQADNVLTSAAKSIAELISITKKMNVDFNDVSTAMKNSGVALMSSGSATGENRAIKAVEQALNSPLLNDNDITGARYVLLDLTSGTDEITMDELGEITDFLQDSTGMSADIKIGYDVDPSLGDRVNVTIIATGYNQQPIPEAKMKDEKRTVLKLDETANEITQPISNPTNSSVTAEPEMYVKTVEPVAEKPVEQPVNTFTPETITNTTNTWETTNKTETLKPVEEKQEITRVDLFSNSETEETVSEKTNEFTWNNPVTNEKTVEEIKNAPVDDSKKYFILTDSFEDKIESKTENKTVNPVETEMENSVEANNEKNYSAEDQQKLNLERLARIRELNAKLKTANGLNDLENEPAYKRRNINLTNITHSSESQMSKFTVDGDGKSGDIRTNNSFLHDNVD